MSTSIALSFSESEPAPTLLRPRSGHGHELEVSLVGPRDAPVVAALGGISATHDVCDNGAARGWWREIAGVGRALDPTHVRILGWTYPTPSGRMLSTRDHAHAL